MGLDLKALLDKLEQPAPAPFVEDDDLIPDVDEPTFTRSEDDRNIDELIDNLDIVEAYDNWNVKGARAKARAGQRESISVRCPDPNHPDEHPSAWLSRDKGCGNCGSCGKGFDVYDLAAWHFGYAVPGYKKQHFRELRVKIAEELGYTLRKTPSGAEVLVELEPEPTATVSVLPVAATIEYHEPEAPAAPSIDWRALLPESTFLHDWMCATADQDLPEEYFFWLGLQMIGLAVGNDAILLDKPPVRGNLFLCLFGPSGIGKTRSVKIAVDLLAKALPYKDDEASRGTLLVPTPGSAETLIDAFSKPEKDEEGKVVDYLPVRGLVRFDELSNLIGRANRVGNVIKPYLMDFYDGYGEVSIMSRGHGTTIARNHFLTAVTSTQPGAIRDLVSQTDDSSGFLNRWVFVSGPAKRLISYGGAPIDVEPLIDPLVELRNFAIPRRTMTLAGGALAAWDTFFHDEIEPMKMTGSESMMTRADLTIKKVILLLTINELLAQPTGDIVERACSLFSYLRASYREVSNELSSDSLSDSRKAIIEFIPKFVAETGREPTMRDLHRGLGKRVNRRELPIAVGLACTLGEIEDYQTADKNKTTRYRVAS